MPSINILSIDDPRMTPPIKYDWQEDALCTQISPEIFFPKIGQSAIDARAICNACPVKMQCLSYIMDIEFSSENEGRRHGVFGGLTEKERAKIQKLMNKNPYLSLEEAVEIFKSKKGPRKRNEKVTLKYSQELQVL